MSQARSPIPSALDTAGRLFGISGVLKSTWRTLPDAERERLLTELMTRSAALRRTLGGDGPGPAGPTLDDLHAELASPAAVVHLQPIVWLPTREVVGFEALTRFGRWAPHLWFQRAWEAGVGVELELAAVDRALRRLHQLPSDLTLGINVSPLTLISEELLDRFAEVDPSRIVLELTEHEPISEYAVYREHLVRLRRLGVRIAIDDAGAGHSSLQHIIQLAPDTVKLDRAITAECDRDPVRRALMTCLATFASQTKTRLVAEGVETEAEADALVSYGVAFGQGYLFGRPEPEPRLTIGADTGGWLVSR